jgi:hypothetical protein
VPAHKPVAVAVHHLAEEPSPYNIVNGQFSIGIHGIVWNQK